MKIRILQVEFDASSQVRDEADAVVVPAVLARECVSSYCVGRGYKPWDELKAAAFTLEGAWVVAFKHIDSVNVYNRADIRGKVANVRNDEATHSVLGDIRFLKGCCDQALLDKAKQGLLNKDVSAAYFDDEVPEPGKFGEDAYDFVQRNVMFGHVAVGIPEGRCPSPFCGMSMDSFDSFLRVTVRDPALFTCRLTTVLMNAKDGVYALVGKLRKNLGASGWAEGDAVVRDFLFDVGKGWTPEKAQSWVKDHRDAAEVDTTSMAGACDARSNVLDSGLVLARSRELLGNMPQTWGRQSVMTNAGWGVRHHDGAL